jgi:hypothetical protein
MGFVIVMAMSVLYAPAMVRFSFLPVVSFASGWILIS